MSDNMQPKNADFLADLSEAEQESLAAGRLQPIGDYFFFQKTDIDTFADNQYNFANRRSAAQKTGYRLSQITLAFGSGSSDNEQASQRFNFIFNLLNWLFGG